MNGVEIGIAILLFLIFSLLMIFFTSLAVYNKEIRVILGKIDKHLSQEKVTSGDLPVLEEDTELSSMAEELLRSHYKDGKFNPDPEGDEANEPEDPEP